MTLVPSLFAHIGPKIVALRPILHAVTTNSFLMLINKARICSGECRPITSGKKRSGSLPDSNHPNSLKEERNMLLVILLMGILSILLFLCISNSLMSSRPLKAAAHKFSNLKQKQSRSAPLPTNRFRFVTLHQGANKAIGAVFWRRPSGRKVTEPAAIAVLASRILHGFACVIRPRELR